MSRIVFLLCCVFISRSAVLGQKQLQGKVRSTDGRPLKDVQIILLRPENNRPLAFAFSDQQGQYMVYLPSIVMDSVGIKFSAIGFETKSILFSLQHGLIVPDVQLFGSTKSLPDVVVRSNPIIQRRDTISYDVKAFSERQDMVLADVLRRIPGLELADNGTVKYQGRAINRYYIEGLNLLDAKYGIANNNIPVGAVEQVQVLENHQPLKVLDSVSISNRAALNIKLTGAARNTLIGRAKTGLGVPALLADGELVPMRFAKTNQVLFSYKYNNAGFNYAGELSNLSDDITVPAKTPLLSIPTASLPSVGQQRYLFNNQHVLSINYLKKMPSGKELKVNIDFISDIQKQNSHKQTINYFGIDTVRIQESQSLRLHDTHINAQVETILNTEKTYTINGVRFGYSGGNDKGIIGFPKLSEQKLTDDFVWIEKYGKLIRKVRKWIHGFHYQVGYNRGPQQLNIAPAISGYFFDANGSIDSLMQKATLKKWYAKAGFTAALSMGRLSFEQSAIIGYTRNKYEAALYKFVQEQASVIADTVNNQFEAHEFSAVYTPKFNYKGEKWKFTIQLPLTLFMHRNNNLKGNKQNIFFGAYDVSGQYTINTRLNVLVSLVADQFFLPAYLASSQFTLVNYRSLIHQRGIVKRQNRRSLTAYLFYKNAIRSLFGHLLIARENSRDNYMLDQKFNGSFLEGNAIGRVNPVNTYKSGASVSKYLRRFKTTASVSVTLQQSEGQQSNTGFISYYTVKTTSGNAKLNTRIKDLVIDYVLQLTNIRSRVGEKNVWNITNNLSQTFTLAYALPFQYQIKWGIESNRFSTDNGMPRHFLFSDVSIRKNMESNKISVDLYWQNLFNQNQMETIWVNGNQIMTQSFQLRPSQCMLRVHFNL